MHKLAINDFRLWIHLGHTEEEKFNRQPVSFTIELEFKTPPKACVTDELDDTVCYFDLTNGIRTLCEKKRFNLVEYLAAEVYKSVEKTLKAKKMMPKIGAVRVTVLKLAPPVPDVQGGAVYTYCYP
jgi:7,8-dihydroneopterin aldolase/epimerase/oxygenase